MQFNQNLALEFGPIIATGRSYSASGGNLGGTVTANGNATGWTTNFVGLIPVATAFSLMGKLGVASINNSVNAYGPGGSDSLSQSKTDLVYGVGLQFDFTNKSYGRFEIENYNVADTSGNNRTSVMSFDFGFRF